jgi:ABC-type transport system involved in multi-copper enzyme maturation permease subunit
MPIHDQGYRRYGGDRSRTGTAWLVIAVAGIRMMLRRRLFLGLLLLAWAFVVVRAVQLYLAAMYPSSVGSYFAATAETFHDFLDQQSVFVFFITIYVGAGLIANDRRANALQIYLSKPLTRTEYVVGKLAILATFLLLVTWVPALLLLMLQVMFAGNVTFLAHHIFVIPSITVFSFLMVLVASFSMLALSSLSSSSRYVGILYTGLVFFTEAMFGVLRFITGGTRVSWISFPANLGQVGNVVFRLPPKYQTPWIVSLMMLLALIAASMLILERRVRGVEVVT